MADTRAVLSWEKVLPQTSSNDVADSLRADIQDPLWLLSRQWQMGEFNADDAGMTAFAHVTAVCTPLQRFLNGGGTTPAAYSVADKPLSAVVEQVTPSFDVSLRLESGYHFKKLLTKAGKVAAWKACCQNALLQFKVPDLVYQAGNETLSPFAQEGFTQIISLAMNGRTVDGQQLFVQLTTKKASVLSGAADAVVDATGKAWMQWLESKFGISPTALTNSWDPATLEYHAYASAALPGGVALCLSMPTYKGQTMEAAGWEATIPANGLEQNLDPSQVKVIQQALMPSPVSFPGMPSTRWWQFEDATIDFGNVQANKTDTGLLLLSEFSLGYSNDWLTVPLSLPVGNLVRVQTLRVTDVFGVQSYVRACPQDNQWNLFQLTTAELPSSPEQWMLLPPAANDYLAGPVLEKVDFIRDEMANLAWAIETTVPDGLGQGMDGKAAAQNLENWWRSLAGVPAAPAPATAIGAAYTYALGSSVPPHWIPFAPVRLDASGPTMSLRRSAMPRFIGEAPPVRIRPRTDLVKQATDDKGHYDLREEEVIAAGITVEEQWRRTRWIGGRTVTWLSRQKKIGRNTQSSGLRFDIAQT